MFCKFHKLEREIMEKFSLKWKDFHSNASKSFGLLRSVEYLHDVRLMTEDFHEVSAHRLVLSACSEYFRNIFKNCKKQEPLICLDGITNEDLKNVLDYIYLGEAHIFQDKLDRFLNVAEKLRLEGLLSKDEDRANCSGDPGDQQKIDDKEKKPSVKDSTTILRDSDSISIPQKTSKKIERTLVDNVVDYSEINLKIKEYGKILLDGSRRCTLCNKVVLGRSQTNFMNHVERNHMKGLSFDCPNCDQVFRSRGSLRNHKNRVHK